VGQVIEWSDRYDEESGEPNGGVYVFEHGDIPRARLCFVKRDGTKFLFEGDGLCEVFWGDEYGGGGPFSTSGWAGFHGGIVRGSEFDTAETLRLRLAEYLDPRDFIQGPLCHDGHCYEDGVGMAHTVFAPIRAQTA